MDFEEEDQSEITDLVIQTHILREEKIRLQDKLDLQRKNGIIKINNAKEAFEEIKRTHNDIEFQQTLLASRTRKRTKKTNTFARSSHLAMTLEIDIENEIEKLKKSENASKLQKQEQQEEIENLLLLAKQKKVDLENKMNEISIVKGKTRDMKKKIKSIEKSLITLKEDTKQIKNQIKEVDKDTSNMVLEAEQFVQKRYRVKSKAMKSKELNAKS